MTRPSRPPRPDVQVARVPVDRLRFHPRNVRKDLGDLRALEASIRAEGVLCPLMAERRGDFLRLLHGHRRLAAARLAGLRAVPVVIVRERDDDEAISLMLAENLHRAGLSAGERRDAVRALRTEFGHTQAGIADRLGVSAATVSRWADPQTRQPRPGGRRVPAGRLRGLVDEWAERAAGGLDADQAAELLNQLRALTGPASAVPTGAASEHARPAAGEPDPVVIERLTAGETVPGATAFEVAAAAVALHEAGIPIAEIARRLDEHDRQVHRWLARHRAGEPLVRQHPHEPRWAA